MPHLTSNAKVNTRMNLNSETLTNWYS